MIPYRVARRSKTILIMLLAALAVHPAMAQVKQHTLSAQQAVDYALKNSAQVKNALIDVKIQLQTNRDVTAAAYPKLDGYVTGNHYPNIPTTLLPGEFLSPPQPGTYFPVQFGQKWNATYGLELSQLLFDGQVFVGLQARDASIDYANLNHAVTEEQIKANVLKIYYQLVVGKKQLELTDANITRLEKLFRDTKAMYENGFQEKLDVDKVTVNLSNLRTDKIKLENTLKTGNIGLKYLMGMPVKDELMLTDSLDETQLKEGLLDDSQFKFDDRKEYQLLQVTEKLGQYNIKRYKMAYVPTVSLNGAYSRNAQRNSFNFFKRHEDWFTSTNIGVRIDVPIFDGFSRDSKVQKAKLELEKTRTQKVDLENNITNEIQTARIKLSDALLTMNEQQKNMQLAEQVYNQTKIKYENGLGSNLEITNAETDLKTAQNNYFSALYDAIIARVDFLKATGKL